MKTIISFSCTVQFEVDGQVSEPLAAHVMEEVRKFNLPKKLARLRGAPHEHVGLEIAAVDLESVKEYQRPAR